MSESSHGLYKGIYEHTRDLKRGNINYSLVKHNFEIKHNLKDSNAGKLFESNIYFKPKHYQTETGFFQFVSLFGLIGTEKLQNRSSKIIWLDRLYVLGLTDKQKAELNWQR